MNRDGPMNLNHKYLVVFLKLVNMKDKILEDKITRLRRKITAWAKRNNLWSGAVFRTYMEYFNDEPEEDIAIIAVLSIDGYLYNVLNGYSDQNLRSQFEELILNEGFVSEFRDASTITFHTEDENLNKSYLDYFEWKWISEIIKPDYTTLYNELFEYFGRNPKKLYNLSPRKLEILVSEVFRNQGFQTELGPGRNDGGIDVKLYQKNDIDQITTLVQIKRYKDTLPIRLESVAALSAIVDDQNADKGLFVTTSRYLPQARSFAARQNQKLTLAKSEDLAEWCNIAKTNIMRDKSLAIKDDYILNLLQRPSSSDLVGKIVHAHTGYGIVTNDFCIILIDSPTVVLLMRVPRNEVSYDDSPYNTRGYEVALTDNSILSYKTPENVFRASKNRNPNEAISFWGQQKLYHIWDGTPQYFDLID